MASEGNPRTEAPAATPPRAGRLAPRARQLASYARSSASPVAAAALVGFGLCAAALAWGGHDQPTLEIEAVFAEETCCSWQVWVNGTTLDDITVLPIQSGRSATYRVPLFVPHVDRLRMPLADAVPGPVRIVGISVVRGSTVVDRVSAREFRGGSLLNATGSVSSEGVAVTTAGAHPFLDLPVTLDAHAGRLQLLLAKAASEPLRVYLALLVLGALAAAAVTARRHVLLIVSILAMLVVVRGLPWLSWRLPFRDSVEDAVGFASYVGTWKTREQFVLNAAALAAVLVPAALVVAARLLRRGQRRERCEADRLSIEPPEELPIGPVTRPSRLRPRAVGPTLVGIPVVLVALAAAPNLRSLIGGPPEYQPSWDGNNLVFWKYLIQRHDLEPVDDFFWPYGFQWLVDLPVPWGELSLYVLFLVWWALLAIGTYLTLGRFYAGRGLLARYLLLTAFWLGAELGGLVAFSTRYVASLAVLMLFTAIDAGDRLLSPKRLLFIAAFAWLALFETAQAGFAIAPILLVLGVEVYAAHRRPDGRTARNAVLVGSMSVAAPAAIAAVVLGALGTLPETVSYYRQLATASSAYAFAGSLDPWIGHPVGVAAFLFWSVPLLLVLGTYGVLTGRGGAKPLSAGVLALGLLALMIEQKQVLRPDISQQIWLPVVFGLAYWAVAELPLAPTRRSAALAVGAGAMAAVLVIGGQVGTAWAAIQRGPAKIAASADALVHDQAEFGATARRAFVPAAFERFVAYEPVVTALRGIPEVQAGEPVWILGDDSPITMMLGDTWPYYFNTLYDASPIAFQQEVLRRLDRNPPARVVWNFLADALVFDSVPSVVRSPLLYDWTIRNFVPERTIGTFAILRPRREGQPSPLGWWRDRLGSTHDLGHIPAVAELPHGSCSMRNRCGSFLVVTPRPGEPAPPAYDVPVTIDGLTFQVRFAASRGAERYVVPLDRVWFWSAAPWWAPRTVAQGSVGNADVALVRRPLDPSTLY